MLHHFDELTEERLRGRPSAKWQWFPEDVLPCWVADMDFAPAAEIRNAVAEYVEGGDLGYPPKNGLPGLREAVCERLLERYHLEVAPDELHPMSGIIPGLYLACSTLAGPGEGVVVQPPVYPPFLAAVEGTGRRLVSNPLLEDEAGYRFDVAGLEETITPDTRLLMLCNPQNPTGRMFSREELEELAQVVLRHRLWVVSDELHADLALSGEHIPFASISPEVASRTLTLYGPTKAFNIAGLKIGFAFSSNERLMERVRAAGQGYVTGPNALAQSATLAAYRRAGEWLEDTLEYLGGNREALGQFLAEQLPEVNYYPGQGTYLAWLDLRAYDLPGDAADYLLEHAKVGLNPGPNFAAAPLAGESSTLSGFVRLNFATSRQILMSALERIRDALAGTRA